MKSDTSNASRLKKLRDEKKLSGTDVAERLNISPQYYYDLEKGERRLNENLIIALAELYGVTTDYILGRADNPNNIIFDNEMIPEELKNVDVELIEIIKDAKESGLTNSELKEVLEFAQKIKKK